MGLTVLLVTTLRLPAQVSLAVAPGSVNATWHSLVIGSAPRIVTTGGVVSLTYTVRVAVAVLPLGSLAV